MAGIWTSQITRSGRSRLIACRPETPVSASTVSWPSASRISAYSSRRALSSSIRTIRAMGSRAGLVLELADPDVPVADGMAVVLQAEGQLLQMGGVGRAGLVGRG